MIEFVASKLIYAVEAGFMLFLILVFSGYVRVPWKW